MYVEYYRIESIETAASLSEYVAALPQPSFIWWVVGAMGASHIPRVSAFLSRSTSGNSSLSAALSAWCGFKTSSHCSTRKRGEAAVSIKTKSHIATDKCITLYFIFVGHKTENFCCFWLFCVLLVVVPFAFCFFFCVCFCMRRCSRTRKQPARVEEDLKVEENPWMNEYE